MAIGLEGIFLPGDPVIDKLSAAAAIRRALGEELPIVGFWRTNEDPSEAVKREWAERGIIPIDIGSEKYRKVGRRSALERIIEVYELPLTPALAELRDIINENNKTGKLRDGGYAIAQLVREAYNLECDQAEVSERVIHAVRVWLDVHDRESCIMHGFPEGSAAEALATRVKENTKTFSVHEYLVNMVILGEPEATMIERAGWFANLQDDVRERRRRIRRAWQNREHSWQEHSFAGGSIFVLETDDRFLAREGFAVYRDLLVLIVRNSRGNFKLLSRGTAVSMQDVAAELKQREPELWFYQPEQELVVNGTHSLAEVRPSALEASQIVEIVRRRAVRKRR